MDDKDKQTPEEARTMIYYSTTNRFLCDVFEEMRKAHETRNYSYLTSLIEEAQWMGGRMEGALADQKDLLRLAEERSSLLKEIKELKELKKEYDQDNDE